MCIYVIHKDGVRHPYSDELLFKKVELSAERVLTTLNLKEKALISKELKTLILDTCEPNADGNIEIVSNKMHDYVEVVLDRSFPKIAASYRYYRNFNSQQKEMWRELYKKGQSIALRGDKSNANHDSALVSTKRVLFSGECSKELYQRFFLFQDELQACRDGYIYVHDMTARRDTFNCCLFDMTTVLKDGFEMGNMWYNEPNTLDTAFDVIGDIILAAAGQQYGGFTVPEIDTILAPYAEKSFRKYLQKYVSRGMDEVTAESYASEDVEQEFKQGFQGWEYKFNTVASSRGDYPFITLTFGIGIGKWEQMATHYCLKVRKEGQGKKGFKKPVLFPKLVFLYDKNLHGEGGLLEYLFNESIDCSMKTMYPDYLSLTGEGYVPSVYMKYGKVISPMGCRAFLSKWFERGGIEPADDNDIPRFIGRANIGVISLNLPMILQKSRVDGTNFYEELDYYLGLCLRIHERTYETMGHMKASCDPLGFCEGGFWNPEGKKLGLDDEIAPIIKCWTASIGITAGEEFQHLWNGKSLREDGDKFKEVLDYLNDKVVEEWKAKTGHLYALYGTPAESLCGKQVEQFRAKFGIIKGVSDRAYVSNSFHCHVTEDITQLEKQDYERRFWNSLNGGKIQYVKYPLDYNKQACITLVRRAMDYGFYEGVNLSLSFCNQCGHSSAELEHGGKCPVCGSYDITIIDRMNGYLGLSQRHGKEDDGKFNKAKEQEILERKSM